MFRQEYWNWTWDDLVVHDLPAIIDFIYKKTGQKTHYVGHSMVYIYICSIFKKP